VEWGKEGRGRTGVGGGGDEEDVEEWVGGGEVGGVVVKRGGEGKECRNGTGKRGGRLGGTGSAGEEGRT